MADGYVNEYGDKGMTIDVLVAKSNLSLNTDEMTYLEKVTKKDKVFGVLNFYIGAEGSCTNNGDDSVLEWGCVGKDFHKAPGEPTYVMGKRFGRENRKRIADEKQAKEDEKKAKEDEQKEKEDKKKRDEEKYADEQKHKEKELATAAKKVEGDRANQELQYKNAHEAEMKRLKDAETKQNEQLKLARDAQEAEDARELKKLQDAKEAADKKSLMDQQKEGIARYDAQISAAATAFENSKTALQETEGALKTAEGELEDQKKKIEKWDEMVTKVMDFVKKEQELKQKREAYENNDNLITKAIEATGQTADGVARFLRLTQGMIGATRNVTQQSNRLDVEVGTFGTMLTRECDDSVTAETYFNSLLKRLAPFAAALTAKGYDTLKSMICADDDEFADIVAVLEKAIKLSNAGDDSKDDEKTESVVVEEEEVSGKDLLDQWKLSQFWDKLEADGYDEPKEWGDIDDDELTEMGFKKGHIKRWKKNIEQLSKQNLPESKFIFKKEMRALHKICFQPETWKAFEDEQILATEKTLSVFSPLLTDFFLCLDGGVKQVQQLMAINSQQSPQQIAAIKEGTELPPAIEYEPTKENKESADEPKTWKPSDDWKIGSRVEIFSKSNNSWFEGKIDKIEAEVDAETNENEEWLTVAYEGRTTRVGRNSNNIRPRMEDQDDQGKVMAECGALTLASIVRVDVIGTMQERFQANIDATRALTVARGVQNCCEQIIRSESTIRMNVLLADQIISLRPPVDGMKPAARELWAAVDKSIVRIMKTSIKMARATDKVPNCF